MVVVGSKQAGVPQIRPAGQLNQAGGGGRSCPAVGRQELQPRLWRGRCGMDQALTTLVPGQDGVLWHQGDYGPGVLQGYLQPL